MVRRQERIGSGRSFHFFTGIGIVIARRRFVFGYKRHGSVAAPLGLGRLPDDAGDALAPGSAVQEWRSPAGGYGRHADRGSKAARIRSIGKRVASDAGPEGVSIDINRSAQMPAYGFGLSSGIGLDDG